MLSPASSPRDLWEARRLAVLRAVGERGTVEQVKSRSPEAPSRGAAAAAAAVEWSRWPL